MDFFYQLIHFLNYHSFFFIIGAVVVFVVVWGAIETLLYQNQKLYRIVNIVLLAVSVYLVFAFTVLYRDPDDVEHVVSLIPFDLLYRSWGDQVMFKSLVLNIIMFMPPAMFFSSAFSCDTKKSALLVILISVLFSVTIETLQFLFQVGQTEIDDVICNTLGGAAGYGLYRLFHRWIQKKSPTKS